MLVLGRDAVELVGNQTAEGVVILLGADVAAQQLLSVLQGHGAVEDKHIVGQLLVLLFLVVIFVLHIADDGFQQVLHGDDTGGAAVLIDNNCHLGFLFFKGFKQVGASFGFRDKNCRTDELGNRLGGHLLAGFRDTLQHILGIDDSNDVIDVVLIDRDSGEALLNCQIDDIGDGSGIFHSSHIGAVGHDILRGDIVKLKDVANHVGLVLFNRAFLVADINHHANLLFGDLFRLVLRIDVEQSEDAVCAGRQDSDKGLCDDKNGADNRGDHQRNLFGIVHRDTLRNQLAQNQVDISEQQGDDDQGNRFCGGIGHIRGHHLSEGICKPLCGRCRSQKAREGHANLDGGKKLGGLRNHLRKDCCALVSVLCHLFELVVVEADDCNLTHREEGIHCNQHQQNHQGNHSTVRVHFLLLFCLNRLWIGLKIR